MFLSKGLLGKSVLAGVALSFVALLHLACSAGEGSCLRMSDCEAPFGVSRGHLSIERDPGLTLRILTPRRQISDAFPAPGAGPGFAEGVFMFRSLNIAATGMAAQETKLDTISNNLANVSTTGYKRQSAEFEDLLYQNLRSATPNAQEERLRRHAGRHGCSRRHHLALDGAGRDAPDEQPARRRDRRRGLPHRHEGERRGRLHAHRLAQDGRHRPPRHERRPRNRAANQHSDGRHRRDERVRRHHLRHDGRGSLDGAARSSCRIATFPNPNGLEATGHNLFAPTAASGEPTTGAPGTDGRGSLLQGALEGSNVEMVEEMVGLIRTQRAYEINSKVINAADGTCPQRHPGSLRSSADEDLRCSPHRRCARQCGEGAGPADTMRVEVKGPRVHTKDVFGAATVDVDLGRTPPIGTTRMIEKADIEKAFADAKAAPPKKIPAHVRVSRKTRRRREQHRQRGEGRLATQKLPRGAELEVRGSATEVADDDYDHLSVDAQPRSHARRARRRSRRPSRS